MDDAPTCPCCGARESRPAGTYLLSTSGAHRLDGTPDPEAKDLASPLRGCGRCGHTWIHPVPADELTRYYAAAGFWQDHGATPELAARPWRAALVANAGLRERFLNARRQLALIRRFTTLDPDAPIVDLGSGPAPFLYHCRQLGLRNLHAVEPAAEICADLTRRGVRADPQTIEAWAERDDLPRFQLAVLSHTLEHVVDPAVVLRGVRRHLAPGGRVFVEVPFEQHLEPGSRSLHLHFYSVDAMRAVLERAGFAPRYLVPQRFNPVEAAVFQTLKAIQRRTTRPRRTHARTVIEHPAVAVLHRFGLAPLQRLFGFKVRIVIHSRNLRALATTAGADSPPQETHATLRSD